MARNLAERRERESACPLIATGSASPSRARRDIDETRMSDDPKALVAAGYDAIVATYLERFGRSKVRDYWLGQLIARLPERARVLDLGCGAGLPVLHELVARGFDAFGVDRSARQIDMARSSVPGAVLVQADITKIEFAAGAFDAVAAFYSITHIPRDEHPASLRRIANWLKPGGLFIASMGAEQSLDHREEWLGVPMFFSHYDAAENAALVRAAGFMIERADVVAQDNEDASFLWIIARRHQIGGTR
jgi:SAM-dependent methyltransferase